MTYQKKNKDGRVLNRKHFYKAAKPLGGVPVLNVHPDGFAAVAPMPQIGYMVSPAAELMLSPPAPVAGLAEPLLFQLV